jgi:hypothetical protein
MTKDPILQALHQVRERYAVRFNDDLNAVYRDLKAKPDQGEFEVVSHSPRRPRAKQTLKKRSQQRGAA